MSDFGIHARLCDEDKRSAVGHKAAREYHISAVSERSFAAEGFVVLVDVCGLARQRALVDLQRIVSDDPAVGDNQIARLENDDIACDDVFGVDFDFLSVADNLGGR